MDAFKSKRCTPDLAISGDGKTLTLTKSNDSGKSCVGFGSQVIEGACRGWFQWTIQINRAKKAKQHITIGLADFNPSKSLLRSKNPDAMDCVGLLINQNQQPSPAIDVHGSATVTMTADFAPNTMKLSFAINGKSHKSVFPLISRYSYCLQALLIAKGDSVTLLDYRPKSMYQRQRSESRKKAEVLKTWRKTSPAHGDNEMQQLQQMQMSEVLKYAQLCEVQRDEALRELAKVKREREDLRARAVAAESKLAAKKRELRQLRQKKSTLEIAAQDEEKKMEIILQDEEQQTALMCTKWTTWDSEQVVLFILGIGDGALDKYAESIRKEVFECGYEGEHLPDIATDDMNMIRNMGIKEYRLRKEVLLAIRRVITESQ